MTMNVIGTFLMVVTLAFYLFSVINTVKMAVFTQKWSNFAIANNKFNIILTMKKIRAAVVGYGNIGHYAVQALEAAKDFEIAGIVRRQGNTDCPLELTPYEVVDDISLLHDVDVAILATPTRSCPDYSAKIVAMGINTVDASRWRTARRQAVSASSLPDGTPVQTLWCACSWRALPPKDSAIPTSVPA